ncbi:MAG TPA: amidohydrolase family protein [Streptosporangiaceae bacterium]|nr:amidohydrolase family protein [Streptosporangiaceae bacterium]
MTTAGRTPSPALPVLDAHHHLWDLAARPQPWLDTDPALAPLRRTFTVAELEPQAAAAGVASTVIVQTVADPGETPEMLALAAAGGLVTAVVGWVDLTAPDVADQLARLAGGPGGAYLAGIRHPVLAEPDPRWLARPDVLAGLGAVAAAGLAYDVVARPGQLPAAVQAAAARPELAFVIDHLGNPGVQSGVDAGWAASFRQLAALPHTVCKLSGILGVPPPDGAPGRGDALAHLRPYYQLALDCFGPGRLMFGSDWPVSAIDAPYASIVAIARELISDLSQAEQAAILSGTARRAYALDAAA